MSKLLSTQRNKETKEQRRQTGSSLCSFVLETVSYFLAHLKLARFRTVI
jgi:hypothetical protein